MKKGHAVAKGHPAVVPRGHSRACVIVCGRVRARARGRGLSAKRGGEGGLSAGIESSGGEGVRDHKDTGAYGIFWCGAGVYCTEFDGRWIDLFRVCGCGLD